MYREYKGRMSLCIKEVGKDMSVVSKVIRVFVIQKYADY